MTELPPVTVSIIVDGYSTGSKWWVLRILASGVVQAYRRQTSGMFEYYNDEGELDFRSPAGGKIGTLLDDVIARSDVAGLKRGSAAYYSPPVEFMDEISYRLVLNEAP